MDRNLVCNVVSCHAELKDEVFVTNCSHIFCCDCAVRGGLTSDDPNQRICPACRTHLPRQSEVFQNFLNPAEDWKSCVLGGMSPSIIMECAGKALSFWAYQMTMEMAFLEGGSRRLAAEHELMRSNYEEKLSGQKMALDRQAKQAESQSAEIEALQQEIQNLSSALREKSRKLTQTEELYQKIKRKKMLEEIEQSASQIVGSNIEAATGVGTMLADQHSGQQRMYPRGTVVSPRYSNAQLSSRYTLDAQMSPPMDLAMQGGMNYTYGNSYPRIQPVRNDADGRSQPRVEVHSTPQTNRQRAPGTTSMGFSNVQGVVAGTPRSTPKGTPRVSTDPNRRYLDPRQPQKPPIRFSGVGLGPGAAGLGASRHAMNDTRATNHASYSEPSIASRAGFRDSRATQGMAPTQSLAGNRHGTFIGSRGYGGM
ncbi:hypothetical protein CONLIGDRAFT_273406 [Coniochaeta ligniaria NRRL 30616]|uniref:RING-type domain-containing protein n=1 Tax=Coniochaeta ligniaria NRRL 30616 TaxID=1408157 RepID=A0A1J7JGP3_9PEZI|nr:hypothetical protein CONLIGDRAFT_273406 [Coniochaeta ligniaria NRRL 30616]